MNQTRRKYTYIFYILKIISKKKRDYVKKDCDFTYKCKIVEF